MRNFIACMCLGLFACGGAEALDVPGDGDAPACELVKLSQSNINPCAYVLPEGTCGELTVYVDGEPQPAHTIKVFCYEGVVLIPSNVAGLCPLREVLLCAE